MKHIEQIQPEVAAEELERIVREEGDATATAALTALLHNVTGCDIPQTDTTPQSDVDELVPLAVSILRRHWTTPLTALGDGTTPMSLADLMRRLIGDRVQGNEALGILPANDNIPTAVAALTKRHIDDGLTLTLTDGTDGSTPTTTSLPDGLSLAQLLCSGLADSVTEIRDSNTGWTMSKQMSVRDYIANFPQAQVFHFNCGKVTAWQCNGNARAVTLIFDNCTEIPSRFIGESSNNGLNTQCPNFIVYIYGLKTTNNSENGNGTIYAGEFYLPDYERGVWRVGGSASFSNSCTKKIYVGCKGSKSDTIRFWHFYEQSTVTDFEIGDGACQNITISNLVGLTPENIYNHILCRLKQDEPMCGEGVTITLGTTNIDKIEAVEEYNLKLTELTDIYGYTFA